MQGVNRDEGDGVGDDRLSTKRWHQLNQQFKSELKGKKAILQVAW